MLFFDVRLSMHYHTCVGDSVLTSQLMLATRKDDAEFVHRVRCLDSKYLSPYRMHV
jgi:hypothetical protein